MAEGTTSEKADAEDSAAELARLRAENEALKSMAVGKKSRKERHFWRSFGVWVLIVLACVLAVLGTLSSWVRTTTLDTNTFVSTVAPLITNDVVAKAVSDQAVTQLFKAYDVPGKIKAGLDQLEAVIVQAAPKAASLPLSLSSIAEPISSGIESVAKTAATKILTSKAFATVWEKTLRTAHTAMVNIVTGKKNAVVTSQGNTVVLDLAPLLTQIKDKLAAGGLGFLNNVKVPDNFGQVKLFTSEQLGAVKSMVNLLQLLSWVLPLLALIFFVLAVWLAVNHRKALLRSAIGLAIAMLVVLIVLKVAHSQLIGQVKVAENLAAVNVIWNTLLGGLKGAVWGLFSLGVVVAIGAGVAGPSKLATWLRTHFVDFFAKFRERRQKGAEEKSPFYAFTAKYAWWFRIAGFAIAVLILVLIPHISVLAIILTIVILGIYLIVIEMLR